MSRNLPKSVVWAMFLVLLVQAKAFAGMKAVRVEGGVTAQFAGSFFSPKAGQHLRDGTQIRTDARGGMVLLHDDGHAMKVGPLSVFTLASGERRGDTPKLTLKEGKVFLKAAKAVGQASSLQVETSEVLAGVRGTMFSVSRLSQGVSEVDVLEGTVVVRAQGVERLVDAGFSVLVQQNAVPPPPVPMDRRRLENLRRDQQDVDAAPNRDGPLRDMRRGALPPDVREGVAAAIQNADPGALKPILQNADISFTQKMDIIRFVTDHVVSDQVREELIQKLDHLQGSVKFNVD